MLRVNPWLNFCNMKLIKLQTKKCRIIVNFNVHQNEIETRFCLPIMATQ